MLKALTLMNIKLEHVPGKRTQRHSALKFDLQSYLYCMCGVDPAGIDALDRYTVQKIIGEAGLDMSRRPPASTLPPGWACILE